MEVLHKLYGSNNPRFTLLFLHGLTGDPQETWTTSCDRKICWPLWLGSIFPELCAYTIGYSASMFASWAKKEMDIHERAVNILEHLAAAGIGSTPLGFICHSLGGILAKNYCGPRARAATKLGRLSQQTPSLLASLERLIWVQPWPLFSSLSPLICLQSTSTCSATRAGISKASTNPSAPSPLGCR